MASPVASTAVRSRRLPLLLLALFGLLVGACADDGELGGPGVGGTMAATIGDVQISSADLEAEVEQWAVNPPFLQVIGVTDPGAPGRRSADLVSFVLSHRVLSEQARLLSAEAGYEPTQEELDQILAAVDQQFTAPGSGGSLLQVYAEEFRQQLARDLAYQNNLQNVLGPDTEAPEVDVNPRYGDAEEIQGGLVQVNPPSGPLPAPADLGV